MKNSLPHSIRSILMVAVFCVSTVVCASNKTNDAFSFEWEVIQKSSCESNNGIIKINVINGHTPYKIVVDEYSHIYSRYSNTADITNSLFYNEADEHLVNDVFFQDEIIIDQLPAGVKVISVTDVYGGEISNMIDIPSSVMQVSISEKGNSKNLDVQFDSSSISNNYNSNFGSANFHVELNRLDEVGSYTIQEVYNINKSKSLEEFMDLLNEHPDLNSNSRNKEAKILKQNIPYKSLTQKHTLLKDLENDKTYVLKIYPDESITGYSGVCMSYTYVFSTNEDSFKTGESNIVSTK